MQIPNLKYIEDVYWYHCVQNLKLIFLIKHALHALKLLIAFKYKRKIFIFILINKSFLPEVCQFRRLVYHKTNIGYSQSRTLWTPDGNALWYQLVIFHRFSQLRSCQLCQQVSIQFVVQKQMQLSSLDRVGFVFVFIKNYSYQQKTPRDWFLCFSQGQDSYQFQNLVCLTPSRGSRY